MDFLEIFVSGSYHSDIKILKILASHSELFRIYGIFRKLQIDTDRGAAKYKIFLDNICLK